MSAASTSSQQQAQLQLSIKKGSRIIPFLLLLLMIVLFIVTALPSGHVELAQNLGLSSDKPLTFTQISAALENDETLDKAWAKIKQAEFVDLINQFFLPFVQAYLVQLLEDFKDIATSTATIVWQLSKFSLLPGLAGLVYRRNFWGWFLAAFTVLVAINASGVLGSLTAAKPMPGSGTIFYFLLSQILVLVLALRLQRHAKNITMLAPRVYNWLLTGILVLVGIACYQYWTPWESARMAAANAPISSPSGTTSPTEVGGALNAGTKIAPSNNSDGQDTPATRPSPSGAMSFLSSGFTGLVFKWEFILIGLPLIYSLLRHSSSWTGRARKNIVVCLDGTSNTPDQMEMGYIAQTNVFKLFNMLKVDEAGGYVPSGQFDASLCKKYSDKQIGFYYAGVGNKYDSDPILQTLGMAAGLGAAETVERAYLDLVRVYQPGDRVFITGFSRGAAIARLLARTIDARGAPKSVWTLKLFGKHRTIWSSRRKLPVQVDVLGCWDTVGAFGVAKTIAGINFQKLNAFKDLTIPDNVAKAYHMLALDEQRDSFEPTLMDPDPIRPERIVEVWFAGDHANIGGGWATDRLSDITLDFLLRQTSSGYATYEGETSRQPGDESWGMYLSAHKFDKADIASRKNGHDADLPCVDPDPLGQVRQWFSGLYNYRPRQLPLHAVLSQTVFERMKTSMPVYAPQALFDLNDALDSKRDLIEKKVAKLAETNSLSQEERLALMEFNNKLRLTRWPQYWAAIVAARNPEKIEDVLSNGPRRSPTTQPGAALPTAISSATTKPNLPLPTSV